MQAILVVAMYLVLSPNSVVALSLRRRLMRQKLTRIGAQP